MPDTAKTYEVRRYMQNGGWALLLRTTDREAAARARDAAERSVGRRAPVDLVEVAS